MIRAPTPHFDYVANEVTIGFAHVSLETEVPIIFVYSQQFQLNKKVERTGTKAGNKGFKSTMTSIEMVNLLSVI